MSVSLGEEEDSALGIAGGKGEKPRGPALRG